MLSELRAVIRNAAKHMTGFQRRKFMATMAMEHCNGSPRQTETSLGFNRRAVSRGLQELELGRPIRNLTQRRGRPRIEQHRQDISRITDEVLSENSQMDFQPGHFGQKLRRVGRSQWLAKPNLLQAAGLARPSTAICLLFAILWVRWYVYFVPLP